MKITDRIISWLFYLQLRRVLNSGNARTIYKCGKLLALRPDASPILFRIGKTMVNHAQMLASGQVSIRDFEDYILQ